MDKAPSVSQANDAAMVRCDDLVSSLMEMIQRCGADAGDARVRDMPIAWPDTAPPYYRHAVRRLLGPLTSRLFANLSMDPRDTLPLRSDPGRDPRYLCMAVSDDNTRRDWHLDLQRPTPDGTHEVELLARLSVEGYPPEQPYASYLDALAMLLYGEYAIRSRPFSVRMIPRADQLKGDRDRLFLAAHKVVEQIRLTVVAPTSSELLITYDEHRAAGLFRRPGLRVPSVSLAAVKREDLVRLEELVRDTLGFTSVNRSF